jgi:hypothetical protein
MSQLESSYCENEVVINGQRIPMTCIPTKEYDEFTNCKIRYTILETQHAELLLKVEEHVEQIRLLREEKELLGQKINKTLDEAITSLSGSYSTVNRKLQNVTADNIYLDDRVEILEKKQQKDDQLLKIGQYIFDFKQFIKNKITQNNPYFKDSNYDVFKMLKGEYDEDLEPEQLLTKEHLIQIFNNNYGKCPKKGPNIKKNGVVNLQAKLKDLAYERNCHSHPNVNEREKDELKVLFLETCNKLWENDETNDILADNVFSSKYI